MSESSLIALGVVALILLGLWYAGRSGSAPSHPDEPRAWRDAELVYAEKLFKAPKAGLVARVDRVYRMGGELELVELKTRESGSVYTSDVIELSAQRVAIQERTGEVVSRRGWVLIEHPVTRRRVARTVMLYEEDEVLRLRDRARDLVAMRDRVALEQLRGPSSARACLKCGQRSRCGARLA
jgi:CRISPR-associated exonuclease Cas4